MDKQKYDIIKSAIEGDKISLIELIKQEQNNIYSTLFYLKKNDIDIFDIMQNILIKLTKNITKLKSALHFKVWLNHIIVNTYYDYLRKQRKEKMQLEKISTTSNIDDFITNPNDNLLYSELDKIVKKSINNLPNHYKIPFTLREIQGLSYNEISDITKTAIGTVKSRIARARAILKENIKSY